MQSFTFQDLLTLNVAHNFVADEIAMADDFVGDFSGVRNLLLRVEVLAAATTETTLPKLVIETTDDLDATSWSEVWASSADTADQVLSLSSELERRAKLRLRRYVRWRAVFADLGTDGVGTLCFRIGGGVQ